MGPTRLLVHWVNLKSMVASTSHGDVAGLGAATIAHALTTTTTTCEMVPARTVLKHGAEVLLLLRLYMWGAERWRRIRLPCERCAVDVGAVVLLGGLLLHNGERGGGGGPAMCTGETQRPGKHAAATCLRAAADWSPRSPPTGSVVATKRQHLRILPGEVAHHVVTGEILRRHLLAAHRGGMAAGSGGVTMRIWGEKESGVGVAAIPTPSKPPGLLPFTEKKKDVRTGA